MGQAILRLCTNVSITDIPLVARMGNDELTCDSGLVGVAVAAGTVESETMEIANAVAMLQLECFQSWIEELEQGEDD